MNFDSNYCASGATNAASFCMRVYINLKETISVRVDLSPLKQKPKLSPSLAVSQQLKAQVAGRNLCACYQLTAQPHAFASREGLRAARG